MFGPELQINDSGCVIPSDEHTFIWIDFILQKLARPYNPLPTLPNYGLNHIGTLVRGMHSIAGENVLSGIYLFGNNDMYEC